MNLNSFLKADYIIRTILEFFLASLRKVEKLSINRNDPINPWTANTVYGL